MPVKLCKIFPVLSAQNYHPTVPPPPNSMQIENITFYETMENMYFPKKTASKKLTAKVEKAFCFEKFLQQFSFRE